MARSLLVADTEASWRDWLRDASAERDLVILDPASADFGPPCRICLVSQGKVKDWRFIGCLEAGVNPLEVLSGAAWLLGKASDQAVAVTFPVRTSPVLRQLALSIARLTDWADILVPSDSGLERFGWPIGAEPHPVVADLPTMVREAQRRARWLELEEQCYDHEVSLDSVTVEGARLGSGALIELPNGMRGDLAGGVLHVLSDSEHAEEEVSQWMSFAHASRVSIVAPEAYEGLICSFADQSGVDFGLGRIISVDALNRTVRVRNHAVPPSPVRILRIGTLRIDGAGRETGEIRPWTV